jgi:hypothetical protein
VRHPLPDASPLCRLGIGASPRPAGVGLGRAESLSTISGEWPQTAHLSPCRPSPVKVALPNRQPPLRLGGRNWSSCPEADLYVDAKDSLEAAIRGSAEYSVRGVGQIAKLGLQEIEIDRLGDELGRTILAGQAPPLIVAIRRSPSSRADRAAAS